MKWYSSFFVTLAAVVILFGPADVAVAQTADGDTPAVEDVCNGEAGAAYGLCNAYCEAMDCESDAPQASDQACDRVAAKYLQVTGLLNLPCEPLEHFLI